MRRTSINLNIPRTRSTYPVSMMLGWAHWNGIPGGGCMHGPRAESWPWWKFAAFLFCNLQINAPSKGWRLWFYARRGALYADVYVRRREG